MQKLNKNIYDVDKKSEISFEKCCPLIFYNDCSSPDEFKFNCNNFHALRVIFLPCVGWLDVLSDVAEP